MTENDVPAAGPEPTSVTGVSGHRPATAAAAAGGAAVGVTMAAGQLHVADLIEQDGTLQRVTSLRLQGAPPTVSVALTGVPGRRSFSPDTRLHVVRGR